MTKTDQDETWKAVKDFPDYEVSTLGRIRSWRLPIFNDSGERIPQYMKAEGRRGPRMIRLASDAAVRKCALHRLVAETFIPNTSSGNMVRHLNDVYNDNRVCNLAWGTAAENSADAKRNGLTRSGVVAEKITQKMADDIYHSKESSNALEKKYHVAGRIISLIRKGQIERFGFPRPPELKTEEMRLNHKITADEAREIFTSPEPHRKIADRFGITYESVVRIRRKSLWASATDGLVQPNRVRAKRTDHTPKEVVIDMFMSPENATDTAKRLGVSVSFVSMVRNRKYLTEFTDGLIPPLRSGHEKYAGGEAGDISKFTAEMANSKPKDKRSVISDAVIAEIFCSKEPGRFFARKYNISEGHVSLIRSGRTRRDITSKLLKSA